ncbi:MAG: flavin reductase family protein [Brevibacterium sp.]|nr:flavin reductase family protein [Brevibacterium sp.]
MVRNGATSEDVGVELRQAFSAFPTGVVAVCALGDDGRPLGMAVNSFTSISLDPPLVAISLANTSQTWPALAGKASLGLSVLGTSQEQVSRQLSSRSGDRFDGVKWASSESGAVHLDDATLWLTCRVRDKMEGGDHTIVVLDVNDVQSHPDIEPLVFHHSRYRTISV